MTNYENRNPFMIKYKDEVKVGSQQINSMKNGEKEMSFKPK